MPLLGTLLKNRRAGETNLAWNLPALAGPETLRLHSADFEHDGGIPQAHAAGALNTGSSAPGVWTLRSNMGRGYLGPEPIKGHGPHRYVFQLFALSAPVTAADGGTALETAKPKAVLAAVRGPALARGRLDGLYTR